MKNNNNNEEEKNQAKRLEVIKYFFHKFKITEKELTKEEAKNHYQGKRKICIDEINKIFTDLKPIEISYIIFSFIFIKENTIFNIINFLDTMNSLLNHFEYYKKKNPNIKYNNSHFDNYLLKRYECSYIFTEYLSEKNCRELKIDNLLHFNYIPYYCPFKEHTDKKKRGEVDQNLLEGCPYAHCEDEIIYHPFVYKKFKCPENCNKENCPFYHVDDDGDAIDRETEIDFESNEIIDIQTLLSGLQLNNEDNEKNKKLNLLLKKKEKEACDFIPTEFNPKTYKLYKCPLGSVCKLDKKLCFNYHGDADRRRNPELYDGVLCPNLYEKESKCKMQ